MSQYVYWINAVVPAEYVSAGDSLAAIVGSEPGDAQSFSRGVKLKAIGGPDTVAAYGVAVAVKQSAVEYVDEFNSAGPYPLLNASGKTDEQIAQAKAIVRVQAGDRADIQDGAESFWASFGYEPLKLSIEA